MRILNDYDKAQPFVKYFYKPMTPPHPAIAAAVENRPIDPEKALKLTEINKLLDPGYHDVEFGYCVLPNDHGFVSMLTRFPGCTLEMFEWWFAWHGLEGLRYAIWSPKDHFDIHISPDTIERRLDSSLSWKQRNEFTTDVVTEDVGQGQIKLHICFTSPEEFGFDMDRYKANGNCTAICANVFDITEDENNPIPIECFCHFARETFDGIEVRHRFFENYHMVGGKPVEFPNIQKRDLAHNAMNLCAHHCPEEYTNLSSFLPQLFKEQSGVPEDRSKFIK